ncbi:MAG: hypothetical protein LBQ67_07810, partial [Treponema sp.]|nr:hypothetical protein [Treponema sp.]
YSLFAVFSKKKDSNKPVKLISPPLRVVGLNILYPLPLRQALFAKIPGLLHLLFRNYSGELVPKI